LACIAVVSWGEGFQISYQGMSIDNAGHVYLAGTARHPGDYWTHNLDVVLSKYENDGNLLWTRQYGTDEREEVSAVAGDGHGNLFVAGYKSGDSATDQEPFLSKFASSGNILWTYEFGTVEYGALGVAVDRTGNILVSRFFPETYR
jgi:hypothetical protein